MLTDELNTSGAPGLTFFMASASLAVPSTLTAKVRSRLHEIEPGERAQAREIQQLEVEREGLRAKLRELGADVIRLAALEGLNGHATSIDLRLQKIRRARREREAARDADAEIEA